MYAAHYWLPGAFGSFGSCPIPRARCKPCPFYVFGALMLAFALMGADLTIILLFVGAYLFIQFYAVYVRLKLDKEQ